MLEAYIAMMACWVNQAYHTHERLKGFTFISLFQGAKNQELELGFQCVVAVSSNSFGTKSILLSTAVNFWLLKFYWFRILLSHLKMDRRENLDGRNTGIQFEDDCMNGRLWQIFVKFAVKLMFVVQTFLHSGSSNASSTLSYIPACINRVHARLLRTCLHMYVTTIMH